MKLASGLVVGLVFGLIGSAALAREPVPRTLSFEDRVKAQRAIERVYYAHQLGATKPFDEAVRTAVLEAKVRKYLDQTAALSSYWKTAVTDYALQRELERMAQGSKMPERLLEIYAALGNDSFLIKECLARPALVDRLTHNFYAFDPTEHGKSNAQADAIHSQLVSGALSPSADHPNRTVGELVMGETESDPPPTGPSSQRNLTPDEFKTRRAELPVQPGQVSEVRETSDAFVFNVVLSETTKRVRVASYVVLKTTWDAWWETVRSTVRGDAVTAVASGAMDLPMPQQGRPGKPSTTCADDGWDNGSLSGPPELRGGHTAVWTGSEMLIWGGSRVPLYNNIAINTGGRYDPATDSWTSMSTTGAPIGRRLHTAVWAGNRMVVWGGTATTNYLNQIGLDSGGRYDPLTDSWTPTSKTGAPSARSGHTAVWTGSLMVVWGGNSTTDRSPLGTGGRYDPSSDSWTATSTINALSARNSHTAVWTGSRMVVWGGSATGQFNSLLNSGATYDPTSDSWTPTSTVNAPSARAGHTAVWTGTVMIVWGGSSVFGLYNGSPSIGQVNTGGRYDPSTDAWTATSIVNAPAARYNFSTVSTGTVMIVWGGYGVYPSGELNTGAKYDPATDLWTSTSTVGAPSLRERHTAVWTGGLMVVWGGVRNTQITFDTGGRYDPATDSWTPTTTTNGGPSARGGHEAVWTGSLMVVWGGQIGYYPYEQYLRDGGRYDPATDNWTPTSTTAAPRGRSDFTAIWTGSHVVVWGGFDEEEEEGDRYLNTGARYDPAADSWAPVAVLDAPSARDRHTAVWTGSRMVVWGGYGPGGTNGYQDTGGRYDPTTDIWTATSMTGAPSQRSSHTSVWTGSVMVVWGGFLGSGVLDTGGRYDPASDSWTATSTTGAPSARGRSLSVWTGSRMVVWGGSCVSGSSGCGAGGQYDPVADSWTPTSAMGAPQYTNHTAVWSGRLMLVWGTECFVHNTFCFNSGGRYDPSTDDWTPIPEAGAPRPRSGHTAVWAGNVMLVWGGGDNFENLLSSGGRYTVGTLTDDDCDGDGFAISAGDCDDHDPSSFPGAPQLCDGRNNDCSDPAWPTPPAGEADSDGDGYHLCQADCDDAKATVFPGAPQLCDGLNNDCNDPAWPTPAANEVDVDRDGARICHGDCDDANTRVGPGFWEFCDGLDNDCSGIADDGPVLQNCEDGNICTENVCDGAAGCSNPANEAPCDDTNDCTSDDICGDGLCQGTPLTGTTCSDGDACTANDTCSDGKCASGTEVICDDNNACNGYEFCSPSVGCRSTQPLNCDDYNPCTDDSCDPLTECINTANTKSCSDDNPCTINDVCENTVCRGAPTSGNACSDFDLCTTNDTCENGQCRGGTLLVCDDGSVCNGVEYCVYYAGCIAGTPIQCYDGNICTDDACDPVRGCVFPPNTIACDDSNPCTSDDACGGGQCQGAPHTGAACNDFNPCTTNDACGGDGACHGGPFVNCDDSNLCTDDLCDPGFGCYTTRVPAGTSCDNQNACDGAEHCDGYGTCVSGYPPQCDDHVACTRDSCDPKLGCVYEPYPAGTACADGDACDGVELCDGEGLCAPGIALDCDDRSLCSQDYCDPGLGCQHLPYPAGTSCSDGNVCNGTEVCTGATLCPRAVPLDCDDHNPCTTDTCDPATGCVFTNNFNACNDGNSCTTGDRCGGGACIGGSAVNCVVLDQCHDAGVCNPATGVCSNPIKPNGTICDDASLCTTGDTCQSGACTPAYSGLNHPAPKSAGYYRKLCEKRAHNQLPYQGDQLTESDAVCVGQMTSTFAGIATIDEICDVIDSDRRPPHGGRHHGGPGDGPNGKDCDKGENELIATALNICRARVCEAQNLDSRCHGNAHTTVSQSFADADAILDDAARDKDTCKNASCELREINNGHALEMNSLTLARENNKVRLTWSSAVLEDGSGTPSSYELWRRPMGSNDAFVKIGTISGLTFLDATAGTALWEYDLTAVIPGD